ncbi:MAG: condensation domain-containing protein, partial [Bifidobacterium sp.]|nr:condensation domain-containing protein [Bifidobacterium sp.]
MFNSYGPSESTIDAVVTPVLSPKDCMIVPIGRPVWNARIYILDAGGEPVPVGVAGELYVGGAGVARGYLNQPELTAERFLPDPFSPLPGARMYRTGDLACYQPDGTIIFLGRADDQIKIRGFRIEPGEIEARLTEQPTVRSAVVIAREDMPGDRRLVGYVIPETGQENCNPAELRRSLAARLPDYMVPAAIVTLDALPLTPNGKLDRRALPAPDYTPTSGRAPRSPQETALAALFAEILGVQDISAEASFFDMGGHSLLATRLISRIRDTLGLELPIRTLFEAPTVEALALSLTHNQETPRPPLTPLDRPSALPLSFAQQRLWFLYRLEGPSPTYNMPLTLQLRGELDLEALQASLQDMVSRHESLRTLFSETEDNARQEILTMDDPRCQLVLEQISATPDTLAAQLSDLAARPFHLEQAIPVRATLLTLETDHHVLLILMHHIASDGWSMVPLMHDLATAYGARQQGETPVMAPLPVQYADYTLWQRTLLGDEQDATSRFSQQATYWQKTLAGLPECITLPTDRSRPAISSYRGDRIPLIIDAELTSRLKCLARQNGASLFMILQTGLAILLGKMGAGDDIAIGTPVAGRTDSALDSLVGFFINTLVLRVDLSRSPRVSQLIGQIRDRNLSAYAHQDLPFEKLVEILNPTRAQNHHPLFQVMLVLQNMDDTSVTLPGLDVSLAETEIFTAKFDLTVGLAEEGDRLCGSIEFATDLFDPETIAQLGKRFLRVLGKLTDSQDKPALSIDILSVAERRMLLEDWNRTDAAIPETTLPALFEAQAARTPDAVAVICNETSLTYAQLNVRANQIAHHLIRTGVKPEDRVGLYMMPSLDLIAAFLGIFKSAATYLPLDPKYSGERLKFIMKDSGVSYIIHDGEIPRINDLIEDNTKLISINEINFSEKTNKNLKIKLFNHSAYIIYTSGSSGNPKGVVVSNKNIINYIFSQKNRFGLSSETKTALI